PSRDGCFHRLLAGDCLLAPCDGRQHEDQCGPSEIESHQEIYDTGEDKTGGARRFPCLTPPKRCLLSPVETARRLAPWLLLGRRLLFLCFLNGFLFLRLGRLVLLGDNRPIDGVDIYFIDASLA